MSYLRNQNKNTIIKLLPASLLFIFILQNAAAKQVAYRLPTTAMPVSQSIELNLDPSKIGYSGKVNIDISVKQVINRIGIHWVDLNVSSIKLVNDDGSRNLNATSDDYDIHWLSDGNLVQPGKYQLIIEFSNDFRTDALGLNRTKYQGNHYLFTQFEATEARSAFPVFDEPSFKIPYQLTLTVPINLEVATNTPVQKEVVQGASKIVQFSQSPPLPSYLIAFTVGPLDKTPIVGLSVPGFIYSPKGTGGQTGFAIKHTPKILDALENYFGIDYPYKKLDFVAVPDFGGAMENAGLVTFNAELILRGDEATGNQAVSSLNVIAHELAHMWYGNLVTMQWWDDLWLNEAFASWMAQKVLDVHYPAFQSNLSLPQNQAFPEDGLVATKPIRKEIKISDDISDGIGLSYTKGHSILNMLEQTMGQDDFRLAIRKYIKTHRWENTIASDLWLALNEQSQFDIGKIADTFLNQAGYPLVEFDKNGKITQKRFRNYGNKIIEQSWNIPLTIKYKLSNRIKIEELLLTDRGVQLSSLVEAEWIMPVTDGNGYFRWKLPDLQYAALIKDIQRLNHREKVALISNSRGLLEAGEINIKEHLNLLSQLSLESNVVVFALVLEEIKLVGERYVNMKNKNAFKSYINKILSPWFEQLGSRTKKGDSDNILQLRPRLLRVIGEFGNNPKLNKEMVAIARQYLDGDKSIDNGLGQEALRIAAMLEQNVLVQKYFKVYLSSNDATLKSNIMRSIYFTNRKSIDYALQQVLNKNIPSNEQWRILYGLFNFNKDQSQIYHWLEKNFEKMLKNLPKNMHGFMPFVMSPICEADNLKRLEDFYEGKDKVFQASLIKTVESESNCLQSKIREADSLLEFLASY